MIVVAFNELEGILNDEQESTLKIADDAEIRRVIYLWTLMNATDYVSINMTLGDGTLKKDQEIHNLKLIEIILYNRDWRVRAVAARLLDNREEKDVHDHLLSVSRKYTHF
jgi:hypothetical protein